MTGTIGSYTYTCDDTGRRVGAVDNGQIITYTYDALYRLVQAQESGGDMYQYGYDTAGNRLSKVDYTGATPITTTYTNDIFGLTQVRLPTTARTKFTIYSAWTSSHRIVAVKSAPSWWTGWAACARRWWAAWWRRP